MTEQHNAAAAAAAAARPQSRASVASTGQDQPRHGSPFSNHPLRNAHLDISQGHRSVSTVSTIYEPPPGPPPNWQGDMDMDSSTASSSTTVSRQQTPQLGRYEGPPGATPHSRLGTESVPPPYDPWHGDGDELRPPPSFTAAHPSMEKSPTANANFDDAARAHAWCRETPLWQAVEHDDSLVQRVNAGDLRLTLPPFTADVTVYQPAVGRTYLRTESSLRDTVLLSDSPIYAAHNHAPLVTGRSHLVYYELQILALGDRYNRNIDVQSGVAIGFVAPPYPAWRLPGWHRGSLAVHGDDGRRYVDSSYGGQEFVAPFHKGDVVGIGIQYAPPVHGDRVSMRAEVFFTRNGVKEAGWDLHEERDRDVEEGDVTGLEGEHDLLAAVGVFGAVEVETRFNRAEWLYKP